MCVIFLAWRADERYPLVVAANRDEFFARPTEPARFWTDRPHILAGRDLQAGGTWLGVTRRGRFAALTNFRDPASVKPGAPSRGELVSRFLSEDQSPHDFLNWMDGIGSTYNGFNLLFGDTRELCYYSNCGDAPRMLDPGIYGLSNHLLDTPWPKVAKGKSALANALAALPDTEPLFHLLLDDRLAEDEELPRTGVSIEWERLLSAAFVRSPDYGTRSSTVILRDMQGRFSFEERVFERGATESGRRAYEFPVEGESAA